MKSVRRIKTAYYSKEILKYLLLTGLICVAATSPYFGFNVMKNILRHRGRKGARKQNAISAFNYLNRMGLIEIRRDGHDLRISLTKEGRKRAGKYQIDDLVIQKPKKWDGKWRIVIFDIPNSSRWIRDIFRKKLKELGFCRLQQSIWIIPYACQEEVALLREFLGANKAQIQVLEVTKLENEAIYRQIFRI